MFCKSCGNELKEGAKVCDKCGARLTPSAGNISGAAAGNSNAAKTFSFKIHAKGRSSIFNTIKQFRGAYKADFTVEDNRLLIDETDNYGETVSSVPYYLIKEFSLKESISPMLIFTYLICALVAIALLATSTEILTGILVLGSFANVGVVKSICKQVQTAAYQGSNHGISATGGFTSHGYSCRNRVSFVN